MESYFPLAEQFVTQSDPSFCSLSSLTMVLNALNFDPKKVWKGLWRWVSEETLQCESTKVCGHSLERIKSNGLSFVEFESLARCHGVKISSHRVLRDETGQIVDENGPEGLQQFRSLLERISACDRAETFIVVNFSRKVLGQTGDGHFSPIGGYHKEKELVLIMDVARFKYPPYWVPLEQLWAAMAEQDKVTNEPRGYFVVSGWNKPPPDAETVEQFWHGQQQGHTHSHSHGHSHSHEHGAHCTAHHAGHIHQQQHSSTHLRFAHDACSAPSSSSISSSGSSSAFSESMHSCTHPSHQHDHTHEHAPRQMKAAAAPAAAVAPGSAAVTQNVHVKAACPPMIRTWEDFKRYIPKNMCSSRKDSSDANNSNY
jgi:hypothetical protein